jgi:hypothetical protein
MDARRIEYHEGGRRGKRRNLVSAPQFQAALDFIEELRRAADIIREAPERWPIGKNRTRRFLLWRFLLPLSIQSRNL